jgi:oligopeptide/dipeptide ABC transporter ATP-binding protein
VVALVLVAKSEGLGVGYEHDGGVAWVVENLDLAVEHGLVTCLIGESGCGKSTIGNAMAGLLPPYARTYGKLVISSRTVIDGGKIDFTGIRGKVVVRIAQDPASALNPYLTIGEQLSIAVKTHFPGLSEQDTKSKVLELLSDVMLGEDVYERYPHQLSGGMKRRAAIALALAPEPKIIVADEPTSALDAYLKYAVASLLKKLQKEWELTLVFITHDVSVARYVCDKVAVVYAGRIVEEGAALGCLTSPLHPYLEQLLKALPRRLSKDRLADIPRMPPRPGAYPTGCKFHPRCPYAFEKCWKEEPPLTEVGGRSVRCWRYHG